MVIAGVLFAVVLMMAGSYGLYRVTAREVMLARQSCVPSRRMRAA
jgi:hypothetical protein